MTNANDRIERLMDGAGASGDLAQVAICRIALGTALDPVEALHAAASGSWTDADWTHEWLRTSTGGDYVTERDGSPVYCSGEGDCSTCESAESDAADAEETAAEAMDCARRGDWTGAARLAEDVRRTETEWGDSPTWGDWADAVEQIAEAGMTESEARAECLRVLADAEAMDDKPEPPCGGIVDWFAVERKKR